MKLGEIKASFCRIGAAIGFFLGFLAVIMICLYMFELCFLYPEVEILPKGVLVGKIFLSICVLANVMLLAVCFCSPKDFCNSKE